MQTGIIMLIIYQILTRWLKGVPVAELPFDPVPFITRFSHRGLEGENFRQVSVVRGAAP